jgi:hypothetical protein
VAAAAGCGLTRVPLVPPAPRRLLGIKAGHLHPGASVPRTSRLGVKGEQARVDCRSCGAVRQARLVRPP